jgi:hypothetical protein
MKPLSELVRINRRFQRSIRVDTDIDQPGALDGFVCPPSTAQALISMAKQVAETGQGAFTWTGPYGSGKSSLAVALAALVGDDTARRASAKAAIGQEASAEILRLLKSGRRNWATLPVVGSRADAATVIGEALSGRRSSKKATGSAVIEKLQAAAEEASGAGLLVIIDEMGKFLEHAAVEDSDVYFFQQLAEAASRSNGRLIVVGVLHQAFDDYAHRLSRETRDEWLKIQGRFADIPLNVAGEEQVLLIARAIEMDRRPKVMPASVGIAEAIQRAKPGTAKNLSVELAACWPLHPVVACLLGPLSRRRFGQNQRSVFGFLNSAEPCGFQDFLSSTEANPDNCYQPFMLWDYLRANLEPSILASPDGHRWSLAVEAVERCEARGADLEHLQVVKTIALVDLFKERSGLVPSRDVLANVFQIIPEKRLTSILEQITTWSIVIFKRHIGAYSIYAGSDFDIEEAVATANAKMHGTDLVRIKNLAMLQPILAKRHYHETGALRWFDVDIASLVDGADRVRKYKPHGGATGLFLLLIPTENESTYRSRKLTSEASQAADDIPVAVGWSRDGEAIQEMARELLALESVRAERAELNGDPVARREVNARVARTAADLEDRVRQAFLTAEWRSKSAEPGEEDADIIDMPRKAGVAALTAVASKLADELYPKSPKISNELLNRIRPSTNAIAAQKALLKCMAEGVGQERLGIVGFPAHGGLYASLLEKTGLYVVNSDSQVYRFKTPSSSNKAGLKALWDAADKFLKGGSKSGQTLQAMLDLWQAPPYGLRDGLFPVFAIAYVLSRSESLAVYLDDVFQPKVTSLLTDRLTQDPTSVRLRWSSVSEYHRLILTGVADVVGRYAGIENGTREPLEVARGLVGVVMGLKPWTLKTTRLSDNAMQVRNLAKVANDPNKFMLDDIPSLFAGTESAAARRKEPAPAAESIINAVKSGLEELVDAYPAMLFDMAKTMFTELRVPKVDDEAYAELHIRAETVRGLTGNYRLDAFATRLATFHGKIDEIEGIASLAASKPPRDWVDRDIDQATVEIAAMAQAFVKAESLAHVKGRQDRRQAMAVYFGDSRRPSPITPEFDISIDEQADVEDLVSQFHALLIKNHVSRDIALAAIAELGSQLAGAPPIPSGIEDDRAPRRRPG